MNGIEKIKKLELYCLYLFSFILALKCSFGKINTLYDYLQGKESISQPFQYIIAWLFKFIEKITLNSGKMLICLFIFLMFMVFIVDYIEHNSEEWRKQHFKEKTFNLQDLNKSPEEFLHSVNLIPDIERINKFLSYSSRFSNNDLTKINNRFSYVKNTENLIIASNSSNQIDYICWHPNEAYSFLGICKYISKESIMYILTDQGFAITKFENHTIFYEKDKFEIRVKQFFHDMTIEICRKDTTDFSLILPNVLKDFSLSPQELAGILKLYNIRLKADENPNFKQYYHHGEIIKIGSLDGGQTDYIFYESIPFSECNFLNLKWTDSVLKIRDKIKAYGFDYIKSEDKKLYFENESFSLQIVHDFMFLNSVEIFRKTSQAENFSEDANIIKSNNIKSEVINHEYK